MSFQQQDPGQGAPESRFLFEILSARSAAFSIAGSPSVVSGRGRERHGQDHDHRQTGATGSGAGKKVMLAAGDTFRAAASEQLSIWGERAGIPVIKHQEGADPAAVVFDAVSQQRPEPWMYCSWTPPAGSIPSQI